MRGVGKARLVKDRRPARSWSGSAMLDYDQRCGSMHQGAPIRVRLPCVGLKPAEPPVCAAPNHVPQKQERVQCSQQVSLTTTRPAQQYRCVRTSPVTSGTGHSTTAPAAAPVSLRCLTRPSVLACARAARGVSRRPSEDRGIICICEAAALATCLSRTGQGKESKGRVTSDLQKGNGLQQQPAPTPDRRGMSIAISQPYHKEALSQSDPTSGGATCTGRPSCRSTSPSAPKAHSCTLLRCRALTAASRPAAGRGGSGVGSSSRSVCICSFACNTTSGISHA